jgi:DNA-binding response OmpR family regulator
MATVTSRLPLVTLAVTHRWLDLSCDALSKDAAVQKKQILVVEDDPNVARTICWNLWEAGYEVTTAEDGLAALHAFDAGDFALITLDLMLPMISGFRLAKLFKRARPETPVMIVSSLSFQEAEEVARAGVDDFLTKPFDPRVLIDKVRFHVHAARRFSVVQPARPQIVEKEAVLALA